MARQARPILERAVHVQLRRCITLSADRKNKGCSLAPWQGDLARVMAQVRASTLRSSPPSSAVALLRRMDATASPPELDSEGGRTGGEGCGKPVCSMLGVEFVEYARSRRRRNIICSRAIQQLYQNEPTNEGFIILKPNIYKHHF